MWFDTHAHLDALGEDPEGPAAAVERARGAGVVGIVAVGTDAATSARALGAAEADAMVWAAAAVHPSETKGWRAGWAEAIEALLEHPRAAAVGETGIDLHWDTSFVEQQVEAFLAHLRMAKGSDKALVVHTRDSVDEVLELLERHGPPERVVFHCWSGTTEQLRRALGLGAFVSFAGNVSFPSAGDLRDAASATPSDRLLVETDSPYLAPAPKRGKANEPANVGLVGEAVARARGDDVEAVAELTTANARLAFGLGG